MRERNSRPSPTEPPPKEAPLPPPPSDIPPPPPLNIRIKTVEQGELASELPIPSALSPLLESSEQLRYKSQFYCKACHHSFFIDERRFKVRYCPKCSAPNPVFVTKMEQ